MPGRFLGVWGIGEPVHLALGAGHPAEERTLAENEREGLWIASVSAEKFPSSSRFLAYLLELCPQNLPSSALLTDQVDSLIDMLGRTR